MPRLDFCRATVKDEDFSLHKSLEASSVGRHTFALEKQIFFQYVCFS